MALRRIRSKDPESGRTLVFQANDFTSPADTVFAPYRRRGHMEQSWIKQHLRITRLFGTSENAVKSQIWIAVSVYVLVAIVKKASTSTPRFIRIATGSFAHPV